MSKRDGRVEAEVGGDLSLIIYSKYVHTEKQQYAAKRMRGEYKARKRRLEVGHMRR